MTVRFGAELIPGTQPSGTELFVTLDLAGSLGLVRELLTRGRRLYHRAALGNRKDGQPLAFSSQFSSQRFLPCILNGQQDRIGIGGRLVSREDTLEGAVRGQLTLLEQRPHLSRKLGLQKLRREAAERAAEVVHVPFEHRERDVNNLRGTLGRFAPELLQTEFAREMWALFEQGELTADSTLKGVFARDETAADPDAVLLAVEDAREEALRRELGRES